MELLEENVSEETLAKESKLWTNESPALFSGDQYEGQKCWCKSWRATGVMLPLLMRNV